MSVQIGHLEFGRHRVCGLCHGQGWWGEMSNEEKRARARVLNQAKKTGDPVPPLVRDRNCGRCGGSGVIEG